MPRRRRPLRTLEPGFTLIELVIVILIIGILAAFGVPAYLKSVETSKADDAVSLVTMAGTTHRMYAMDHSGQYLTGSVTSSCLPGGCTDPSGGPCQIVACRYLASEDFSNKPYALTLDDPGTATSPSCSGTSLPSHNYVAHVCRQGGQGTYAGWGYGVDSNGKIYWTNGSPTPVTP